MDKQKIDDVVRYYDRFYNEVGRPKRTSIGCYNATNLRDAQILFDHLYKEQFLDPRDVCVDAGGGDGRIAALLSVYGVNAVSIEADAKMHKLAEKRIQELHSIGVLPYAPKRANLQCIEGNFLDTEMYTQKLHLSARLINIVFNACTNEAATARFVKQQMRNETYLITMQSNGAQAEQILRRVQTFRDCTGRYIGSLFVNQY